MSQQMLLGAIDLGTTSVRMILFDAVSHQIVHSHQQEFPSNYPQPGWCEQDPTVIMDCVQKCMNECARLLLKSTGSLEAVKCIGITNQRETVVAWDRQTGRPLHPAIVWMDTRTHEVVVEMTRKWGGSRTAYQHVCGLPVSTYFSAPKIRWLLENCPAVSQAAINSSLLLGTIDSWVIWNLTGGKQHVTDVTNASRTMLMDLRECQWSRQMATEFQVPLGALPVIRSSAEMYGTVDGNVGSFSGVPISGCLGDQQSALVGQQCFRVGDAKNTYGTGCFMLYNTGSVPVQSSNGLLTTVGYQLGVGADVVYALEGSVAIAGAAVQWLRDNLGIIREAKECGELAEQVSDTGDVYFVPAFSGLFAPHWREDARGVLTGLTQFTTKHHICRATLEAVAFQTRDILDAMRFDSTAVSAAGKAAGEGDSSVLKVDGGMCASRLLMQLQADLAGCRVRKPAMQETTALGAAIAAAIGINIYKLSADRHTLLPGDAWPVEFIKPDKLVFDDHTDYLPAISQEGLANDQNEAIAEKVDSNLVWLPYRQNLTAFLLADNQAGHPNVSFASRKVSNYLRELCGHQLSQTLP